MQKIEELKTKVTQETAARDGLMKMKGVYEGNPALGDPRTIESKLSLQRTKIFQICPIIVEDLCGKCNNIIRQRARKVKLNVFKNT